MPLFIIKSVLVWMINYVVTLEMQLMYVEVIEEGWKGISRILYATIMPLIFTMR